MRFDRVRLTQKDRSEAEAVGEQNLRSFEREADGLPLE